MSEPNKLPLQKQCSLSHIEQSIKIIPCPPQQAPVTIYLGPKAANQNMSKADLEIADRLDKLRKRNVEELPTEEEMAFRLANLKGLPPDHYIKTSFKCYQPPDLRTQTEKSECLLKQVMEEVALDSKVKNPEDEIQARLSRLKGEANATNQETSNFIGASMVEQTGSEVQESERDEIAKLMSDAEREMNAARASLNSLEKDEELLAEVKKQISTKKRNSQKKRSSSTSSDERFSGSDDEGLPRSKAGEKNEGSQKEKEEVERIVGLYTKRALQKKEKRKALKKKQGQQESDSGDPDLSDSDVVSSTSESERLSDSD